MPAGFLLDRQANSKNRNTISLFLDHSLLAGDDRVADPRNSRKTLRPAVASHQPYGALVEPVDLGGLIHHAIARSAAGDDLLGMLAPHQTTVLDVVLPRKVHEGVFRLTQNTGSGRLQPPGSGPRHPLSGSVWPYDLQSLRRR